MAPRLVAATATLAGGVAIIALAGWALDYEPARSWLPGAVAMNPATAIILLCLAVSLRIQRRPDRLRRAAQGLALLAFAFGVLKLGGIFFGLDIVVDRLLFADKLAASTGQPNRMAPNTALCFLLLGSCVWLFARERRIGLAQFLAALAGGVSFFALLGYSYHFAHLYRVPTQIPMALNTAVAFLALAAGALALRPWKGVAAVVTYTGSAGYLARRVLPVVIVVPAVLGALRLWGERSGYYGTQTGAVMLVVSSIVLLTTLIGWAAWKLEHADRERRVAEEALRESTLFLESIIENIPLMVFVKEAAGLRFVKFNAAGEDLVGHTREEMIGKSDHDFFPPEQADFFTTKDRDVLRGARTLDIPEEPIHTPSGTRLLHTLKVPIFGADGEPRFLLGISQDVTERKRTEERIHQLNKELEAFSYSVSHDLRAPLRAIVGFSQALLEDHRDRLDETGRGMLDRIVAAGRRMSDLIDDLLAFSRLSRADLHCQPVDVSAIAREVEHGLREADPTRQVEIVVADGLHAKADPRLLKVVLENLLGNAWKFTGKRRGGRIELGVAHAPNGRPTTFFVRDDGAGFDMRYAEKLFAPFQRLHAAHEFEGTGIGLATVQRIVQRHGGRISAEGAVGEGASFYFTLEEG